MRLLSFSNIRDVVIHEMVDFQKASKVTVARIVPSVGCANRVGNSRCTEKNGFVTATKLGTTNNFFCC